MPEMRSNDTPGESRQPDFFHPLRFDQPPNLDRRKTSHMASGPATLRREFPSSSVGCVPLKATWWRGFPADA